MRSPTGFLEHDRELPRRRPVAVRLRDTADVYKPAREGLIETQASRCMDCGVAFCHAGCPLGNLIPEWNGLLADGQLADAAARLHATNNFPEFTGTLCPAPCEAACVLGISDEPVAIERIELEIAVRAFAAGHVVAIPPHTETGRRVAVVGSGPAGLAAAQQLRRAGHEVVVYERDEAPGGLLRYGIPSFKLDKSLLERRARQLADEGVEFVCETEVVASERPTSSRGRAAIVVGDLARQADAVVLATGSTVARDLEVPGRPLRGVVFALELLRGAQLHAEGRLAAVPVDADGRDVVIIGGGDTGSDCLGTVLRQGARSVRQLEILPRPPTTRSAMDPWPTYPSVYRVSSSHEEGGDRSFAVRTVSLADRGDGAVGVVEVVDADSDDGAVTRLHADLVVLAMGFTGVEPGLAADLGVAITPRGALEVDDHFATSVPGVFACGDAVRGQSLIVWAIAEGRSVAASVDRWLMGHTELPVAVSPRDRPLR